MGEMNEEFGGLPENYRKDGDNNYHGYEPGSAQFTPDQLEEAQRRTMEALQAMGVTGVRVLYDGGGDEGFAHFDYARTEGAMIPLKVLCARLASGVLGDAPQETRWYPASMFEQMPREEVAKYALDDFAYALASRLLGDGFGTGDYSMYGAFEADFRTGQIVDDPEAQDPYANEQQ